MKNKNLIILGVIVAAYLLTRRPKSSHVDQMRQELVAAINQGGDSQDSKAAFAAIVARMTPQEIEASWSLVVLKVLPKPGTPYFNQIEAIRVKYNIFT